MWINMKPFTTQLYNPKAISYTIGISSKKSIIDQKRNLITLRPGNKMLINVLPRRFETTQYFDGLEMRDQRKCKLSHETAGFEFLQEYSRVGCEMECAAQQGSFL